MQALPGVSLSQAPLYTHAMPLAPTAYVVALSLCLFACGILNARFRGTRRVAYFGWYFGLEAACCLFETLVALESTPFKALWLSLLMICSLLIAPALWLALLQATGARPSLANISMRQRLLVASGALLTLPLLATSHGGTTFDDAGRVGATFLEPLIHETMVGCLALFAIQVPIYLLRCRTLLANEVPQRWLQIPLAIVFTTWILGMVRTVLGVWSAGNDELLTLIALIDVGATVGCAYLILRTLAGSAVPAETAAATSGAGAEASVPTRYAKSHLDASARQRIRSKIEAAFRVDALHRRSDLNLASLSRALNEREHYVSQVINQDLGTTFYELVNRHRIEQARQLLRHSPELGVLEIAMAVGFNAKSTFNNAFRRLTGTTPREYRAATGQLPKSPADA